MRLNIVENLVRQGVAGLVYAAGYIADLPDWLR